MSYRIHLELYTYTDLNVRRRGSNKPGWTLFYNRVLCLSNPGKETERNLLKARVESRTNRNPTYPIIYLPNLRIKFDSYSYVKNNDTKYREISLVVRSQVCTETLIKFLLSPNKLLQNISSNKNWNGNDLPLIYVAFNKRIFIGRSTKVGGISVARKIKP